MSNSENSQNTAAEQRNEGAPAPSAPVEKKEKKEKKPSCFKKYDETFKKNGKGCRTCRFHVECKPKR